MIVLLEGGEGAGKTTLAKRLEQEYGFKFVKFPSPGTYLESVIFNKESPIEEKAAAATLDFCQVLREEMKSGKDLVLDRGPWSTIAYQGPLEFADAIKGANAYWTVQAITHIFLLDVDVDKGLAREAAQNAVSAAGLEFHTRVNRRMRFTYGTIKQMHGEDVSADFTPTYYPVEGETANRAQWFQTVAQMPWTRNVYRVDTNDSDADKAYLEVLEGLGLVGAAG